MRKLLPKMLSGSRFRASLRVLGYVSVVNLGLLAVTFPLARAHAEHAAKEAGLELLRQMGPIVVGPPQAVTLNGQRMFLGSKVTSLSVHDVLGRFDQYCREDAPGPNDELNRLPKAVAELVPEGLHDPNRWFAARTEASQGDVGQLACFAGKASGGFNGALSRVKDFIATGDLSKLGEMRYVVARSNHETGKTHVLTMWTEGAFNIRAMFPKNGDVPGTDSEHAPRPPNAVRILSSQMADQPYSFRVYNSAASQAEVLGGYVREMTARGFWAPKLPTRKDGYDLNQNTRAFVKDGGTVIVVATPAPNGKTGVSLIEMGTRGFIQVEGSESP